MALLSLSHTLKSGLSSKKKIQPGRILMMYIAEGKDDRGGRREKRGQILLNRGGDTWRGIRTIVMTA